MPMKKIIKCLLSKDKEERKWLSFYVKVYIAMKKGDIVFWVFLQHSKRPANKFWSKLNKFINNN